MNPEVSARLGDLVGELVNKEMETLRQIQR